MADENKNRELSFLDEKKGPKVHVKDVLFIVLRNLHWLIICGVLGAAIAGLFYKLVCGDCCCKKCKKD